MKPAVFLDRDGTINVDSGYVHQLDELVFIEGAQKAVRRINEAGYLAIVVTNQSGVARGYYLEESVMRFHQHMSELLEAEGAHIDAYYYCPHLEGPLRKPATGMFELAMQSFDIDVARSWMIGDKASDMGFARAAGLSPILVRTGKAESDEGAHVCDSIVEAVEHILG